MSTFDHEDISQTGTSHSFYMPVRITGLSDETFCSERERERERTLFRILVVWDGEGSLSINDQQHEISRGSIFLCNTNIEVQLKPSSLLRGVLLEYRCLSNDGSKPSGLHYPLPLQNCPSGLLKLAYELEMVWRDPQLSEPFRAQHLFIELLAGLHQELAANEQPSTNWFTKIMNYIDNHYQEDLTREELAELAKVSPEHLSRTFRSQTGRTLTAYLTLLRIRSAQRRILTGSPDLNTLAHEVGYKEGFYLSRKFKESVGLSPTAYQRKHKRIAALNYNHTACLAALGVTPELGVYTSWLEHAMRRMKLDIGQPFNPYGQTSEGYYNEIAVTAPDVIISYNLEEQNKNLLPLAPVMELPFMTMSWREQFHMIAGIVNRQQQAAEWLKKYDKLVVRSNHRLDRMLGDRGTAIVWEIGHNKAYCFGSSFGRGCQVLYDDFGFFPPTELIEQDITASGYLEVEIESIASYPAAHIFITEMPTFPEAQQRVNRLLFSPQWLKLEAVRNNRVYLLNEPEMFFGYDPISSQAQLRELLRALMAHHKNA